MATAGPMATPTDTDILTLAQWLSPAYPVGGFAYSHGLEWEIESGSVSSVAETGAWIADVVEFGTGRNDCILLSAAYAAPAVALAEIDQTARAFCPSSERLRETRLLGEAFSGLTADVWSLDLPPLTYPVALGHAAGLWGLPLALTAQMYLQAFMSNLVACATRLVPLGQTESQRLIRDLTPLCQRVATGSLAAKMDDLGATAFLSDIASMKHETQYSRMFRT
ncbi:urease accessory protein UreF [Ruegeria lacuscaerulensis]|uniref:urease accessory protein UreF n=1 Tax=Ruegeria lacuscaerulensis TaxID=55218 RepID=UPI001F1DE8DD|nr:urease accessory UreF family protein [Ruegeria lacuscaerulensis]